MWLAQGLTDDKSALIYQMDWSHFTEDSNPSLAKQPVKFSGALA